MANFGEALRKERESRGIALDAVSGATKISLRHLNAVESDSFEQLPGGLFNKNIVRNYARTLGLDENEWVDRFMTASRQPRSFEEDDLDWTAFAENVGARARQRPEPFRQHDALGRRSCAPVVPGWPQLVRLGLRSPQEYGGQPGRSNADAGAATMKSGATATFLLRQELSPA